MVTGAHSLGGYRKSFSSNLADCSFEPFDCTPNGYFVKPGKQPFQAFDNDAFRVACAKQDKTLFNKKDCPFYTLCPDVSSVAAVNNSTCPYTAEVAVTFYRCEQHGKQGTKLGIVDGTASDQYFCKVSRMAWLHLAVAAQSIGSCCCWLGVCGGGSVGCELSCGLSTSIHWCTVCMHACRVASAVVLQAAHLNKPATTHCHFIVVL
jgi:hypothetical protein